MGVRRRGLQDRRRGAGLAVVLSIGVAVVTACAGPRDDEAPCAAATPLRRLTRVEYDNTIRDLLGWEGPLATALFPEEARVDGFDNQAAALVSSPLLVEQAMVAAERAADHALGRLDRLAPCSVELGPDADAAAEEACAAAFLTDIGARALRRPLDDALAASLLETFRAGRAEGGAFAEGIRWTLERLLQSPGFLFRLEIADIDGDAGDGVGPWLDGYAVASRLSYLLWRSMPDDALFAAAAAGALEGPAAADAIEAEARRMLDDPRARATLLDFHRQWLDLDALDRTPKSLVVFPEYTPALVAALREETERFLDAVLWGGEGDLPTLLGARWSVIDGRLADLYEVDYPGADPASGDPFVRVELGDAPRAGVLLQGSVLAAQAGAIATSPVRRGRFVRERLLCEPLTAPPPGSVPALPEPDPDATTRSRYEAHVRDPACAGCHTRMDPIGFGLEGYDAIGRRRSVEGDGLPIDERGTILAIGGAGGDDIDFEGGLELAERLAERPEVHACYARQWLRFSLGRREDPAVDACAIDPLGAAMAEGGGDVRELLIALVRSQAFRRGGAGGEG